MSHTDLGQVTRVDGNILLITLYLTGTQDSENNVKTSHGYVCYLNMLLLLARRELRDRGDKSPCTLTNNEENTEMTYSTSSALQHTALWWYE